MIKPPSNLKLNKDKNLLTITFDNKEYELSTEFLRTHSPSAEVVGHGPGQEILQLNKENIRLKDIRPVGNYAVKLVFSDQHDSGLYSWEYLTYICQNKDDLWQKHLARLEEHGHTHKEINCKQIK